jgi:DNA polymerase-1
MTYSSRTQCYLFDGMALLFRSFYAMSRTGLTSPQGTPIGAVYGFLRILLKILEKKELSHLAVCWDLPEPTFRHHMYPAYKGTRSSPPEGTRRARLQSKRIRGR